MNRIGFIQTDRQDLHIFWHAEDPCPIIYMEALNEVVIGGDAESIDYIASKVIMVIEEMEKQNKCYIMTMYKLKYIKIANKLKGENCNG